MSLRISDRGKGQIDPRIGSTSCYTLNGMDETRSKARVFKTAWFRKAARKALIGDEELCVAIRQVMLGQAADLGGGVYKKRLGRNLYRSIIIARGGRYWVYEYLFAKQNKANIDDDDLARLRSLAKAYELLADRDVDELIRNHEWMEICDGNGA
jgi:hypothetical protein